MPVDYRPRLLAVQAVLDQCLARADKLLFGRYRPSVQTRAWDIREMIADVQANVQEKLDYAQ